MNIAVLVKQVPAVSDIQLSGDNNLVRVGAPSMLNPVDLHAIEAALALKDQEGGTVTLVTMGTALASDILREGIALGADKGILLSDERMAGSDTLATGQILAAALAKLGPLDLVLAGKRSTDGDTGQIPPALAQRLGMTLLSYAEELEVKDGQATIRRLNRGGVETLQAALPAVISVTEKCGNPRTPGIRGKMAAKKAVFPVWRLEDIDLAPEKAGKAGSATKVTELFAPEPQPVGTMIQGATPVEAAANLVYELRKKNLL
ncbi:electron transfer flavoprotein subunit beta/FixA family protein [uncultured Acidaminococcus sp.]|uniref:electron transfer flavoprotein subunit beta/FixA family protein n=1 Tax=uncultured Acidaminococcus sp. TaxID=352152 RepID=UPI00265E86DB|nr:electron transfer flavoprotein subunit beta/FixA family protein [uncultured Acidaminococcus sp.]